jgi:hypothetical protein
MIGVADGSVRFVHEHTDPFQLRALLLVDDGQPAGEW